MCVTITLPYLQALVHNPGAVKKYSHIILDEIHERSTDADFALLVIRELLTSHSPDVKLVIMSATMQGALIVKYLRRYFADVAGPYFVGTKHFPVASYFVDEIERFPKSQCIWNECQEVAAKNLQVLAKQRPEESLKSALTAKPYVSTFMQEVCTETVVSQAQLGESILIFLPGFNEIVHYFEYLSDEIVGRGIGDHFRIFILHSQVPFEDQKEAFIPPPKNKAHVILATNIAESSITLPKLRLVINFGIYRRLQYDQKRHISCLMKCWCSRASCEQRAGRAGRVFPGTVLHLFTRHFFDVVLPSYDPPEILTTPIAKLVLQAKHIGRMVGRPRPSEFLSLAIEPPSLQQLEAALQDLANLGAIKSQPGEEVDEEADITFLGYFSLSLPVDLDLCRLIFFGLLFGCTPEAVVTTAAMSLSQDVFSLPSRVIIKEEEKFRQSLARSYECRCKLDASTYSDAVMVCNLFREWLEWLSLQPPASKFSLARSFSSQHACRWERLLQLESVVCELSQRALSYIPGGTAVHSELQELASLRNTRPLHQFLSKNTLRRESKSYHVHFCLNPDTLQAALVAAFPHQLMFGVRQCDSLDHLEKARAAKMLTLMLECNVDIGCTLAIRNLCKLSRPVVKQLVEQVLPNNYCQVTTVGSTALVTLNNTFQTHPLTELMRISQAAFLPPNTTRVTQQHPSQQQQECMVSSTLPPELILFWQYGERRPTWKLSDMSVAFARPEHPLTVSWFCATREKERVHVLSWRNPTGFVCEVNSFRKPLPYLAVAAHLQGTNSYSSVSAKNISLLPSLYYGRMALLLALTFQPLNTSVSVLVDDSLHAIVGFTIDSFTLSPLPNGHCLNEADIRCINQLRKAVSDVICLEASNKHIPASVLSKIPLLLMNLIQRGRQHLRRNLADLESGEAKRASQHWEDLLTAKDLIAGKEDFSDDDEFDDDPPTEPPHSKLTLYEYLPSFQCPVPRMSEVLAPRAGHSCHITLTVPSHMNADKQPQEETEDTPSDSEKTASTATLLGNIQSSEHFRLSPNAPEFVPTTTQHSTAVQQQQQPAVAPLCPTTQSEGVFSSENVVKTRPAQVMEHTAREICDETSFYGPEPETLHHLAHSDGAKATLAEKRKASSSPDEQLDHTDECNQLHEINSVYSDAPSHSPYSIATEGASPFYQHSATQTKMHLKEPTLHRECEAQWPERRSGRFINAGSMTSVERSQQLPKETASISVFSSNPSTQTSQAYSSPESLLSPTPVAVTEVPSPLTRTQLHPSLSHSEASTRSILDYLLCSRASAPGPCPLHHPHLSCQSVSHLRPRAELPARSGVLATGDRLKSRVSHHKSALRSSQRSQVQDFLTIPTMTRASRKPLSSSSFQSSLDLQSRAPGAPLIPNLDPHSRAPFIPNLDLHSRAPGAPLLPKQSCVSKEHYQPRFPSQLIQCPPIAPPPMSSLPEPSLCSGKYCVRVDLPSWAKKGSLLPPPDLLHPPQREGDRVNSKGTPRHVSASLGSSFTLKTNPAPFPKHTAPSLLAAPRSLLYHPIPFKLDLHNLANFIELYLEARSGWAELDKVFSTFLKKHGLPPNTLFPYQITDLYKERFVWFLSPSGTEIVQLVNKAVQPANSAQRRQQEHQTGCKGVSMERRSMELMEEKSTTKMNEAGSPGLCYDHITSLKDETVKETEVEDGKEFVVKEMANEDQTDIQEQEAARNQPKLRGRVQSKQVKDQESEVFPKSGIQDTTDETDANSVLSEEGQGHVSKERLQDVGSTGPVSDGEDSTEELKVGEELTLHSFCGLKVATVQEATEEEERTVKDGGAVKEKNATEEEGALLDKDAREEECATSEDSTGAMEEENTIRKEGAKEDESTTAEGDETLENVNATEEEDTVREEGAIEDESTIAEGDETLENIDTTEGDETRESIDATEEEGTRQQEGAITAEGDETLENVDSTGSVEECVECLGEGAVKEKDVVEKRVPQKKPAVPEQDPHDQPQEQDNMLSGVSLSEEETAMSHVEEASTTADNIPSSADSTTSEEDTCLHRDTASTVTGTISVRDSAGSPEEEGICADHHKEEEPSTVITSQRGSTSSLREDIIASSLTEETTTSVSSEVHATSHHSDSAQDMAGSPLSEQDEVEERAVDGSGGQVVVAPLSPFPPHTKWGAWTQEQEPKRSESWSASDCIKESGGSSVIHLSVEEEEGEGSQDTGSTVETPSEAASAASLGNFEDAYWVEGDVLLPSCDSAVTDTSGHVSKHESISVGCEEHVVEVFRSALLKVGGHSHINKLSVLYKEAYVRMFITLKWFLSRTDTFQVIVHKIRSKSCIKLAKLTNSSVQPLALSPEFEEKLLSWRDICPVSHKNIGGIRVWPEVCVPHRVTLRELRRQHPRKRPVKEDTTRSQKLTSREKEESKKLKKSCSERKSQRQRKQKYACEHKPTAVDRGKTGDSKAAQTSQDSSASTHKKRRLPPVVVRRRRWFPRSPRDVASPSEPGHITHILNYYHEFFDSHKQEPVFLCQLSGRYKTTFDLPSEFDIPPDLLRKDFSIYRQHERKYIYPLKWIESAVVDPAADGTVQDIPTPGPDTPVEAQQVTSAGAVAAGGKEEKTEGKIEEMEKRTEMIPLAAEQEASVLTVAGGKKEKAEGRMEEMEKRTEMIPLEAQQEDSVLTVAGEKKEKAEGRMEEMEKRTEVRSLEAQQEASVLTVAGGKEKAEGRMEAQQEDSVLTVAEGKEKAEGRMQEDSVLTVAGRKEEKAEVRMEETEKRTEVAPLEPRQEAAVLAVAREKEGRVEKRTEVERDEAVSTEETEEKVQSHDCPQPQHSPQAVGKEE